VFNNILLKATPENVVIHEYLNSVVFESIIRNKYKLLFEEILAVRNFLLSVLTYTYRSRSVLPQKRKNVILIVKFCYAPEVRVLRAKKQYFTQD